MLPQNDLDCLTERAPGHSVSSDAGMICVVLPNFALGPGYDRPTSDLMLRLAPGYPDVAPDMWWFHPPVRRTDGAQIAATQTMEHHLGREWQRWSRHLQPGQWRSGIDSLESYLAIVRRELTLAAPKAA
ncbi:E2/UBC family protein [Sphingobium sp. Sx8-8]|uniref:E2/UBC family protein n=1 Tax=Sphingobium sp. Sx8-8 TaxID=2933617 RepID=UPI001F57132A|nr:E2/UBC family protein [Sphingobium sp. Sx8-8]